MIEGGVVIKPIRFAVLLLLVISIAMISYNGFLTRDWERNRDALVVSVLEKDSKVGTTIDLSECTQFDWDKAYAIEPYLPEEDIERVIGRRWPYVKSSTSEGMNNVIFMKDDEVVCYLYGFPSQFNLGFRFREFENGFVALHREDKVLFRVADVEGVLYLEHVEE